MAKFPILPDFTVSPDLDVDIAKNPQKLLILAFLTNFWWFWIWTIWQRCRNGQNYQISQCCQIWMWISPKIPQNCWFWRFWPILVKKDMEHLVTMSGHNKNPFLGNYQCNRHTFPHFGIKKWSNLFFGRQKILVEFEDFMLSHFENIKVFVIIPQFSQ